MWPAGHVFVTPALNGCCCTVHNSCLISHVCNSTKDSKTCYRCIVSCKGWSWWRNLRITCFSLKRRCQQHETLKLKKFVISLFRSSECYIVLRLHPFLLLHSIGCNSMLLHLVQGIDVGLVLNICYCKTEYVEVVLTHSSASIEPLRPECDLRRFLFSSI